MGCFFLLVTRVSTLTGLYYVFNYGSGLYGFVTPARGVFFIIYLFGGSVVKWCSGERDCVRRNVFFAAGSGYVKMRWFLHEISLR